jgi:nucleotide-binding universal stress UspA family protein
MNTQTDERFVNRLGTPECLTDLYKAALTSTTNANEDVFKIKNILVVTRPSESSAEALKYAGSFSSRFDCKITILHVVPVGCSAVNPQELQEGICKNAGIEPAQIRAIFVRQGVTGFSALVEAARDEDADLLVIAADFYKEPIRFWQTNLLEKVIRHAPCPLLIVGDKVQPVSK